MTSVLCVGIAVLDYVYALEAMPTVPEKYRSHDLRIVGGGIAANGAATVARLGGRALLATRLGDDLTGGEIIAMRQAEGVDCSLCHRFPGRRSPVSAVLVDKAGERTIISYSDPDMPVAPDWLPATLPEGVGAVMGDTRWPEGCVRAFELAQGAGVPSVLDGDRAPQHPDMLRLATHAAFSVQGIREVTGEGDPVAALRRLMTMTPHWVAVTCGGEGVWYRDGDDVAHAPAFRVDVVDTLGAGDVWHGAFAFALARGDDAPQAVRFANATAAIKCTRFGGGAGTPTLAEVETFLNERAA
jgi:sulfofructose kinase